MPYPPKDGGAIATFSLAYSLSNFAEIHILAINTPKHYFDVTKIPENITKKIKFHTVFVDTDIKITNLVKNLLFSKLPYNAERFINREFENKIIDILSKEKFDIIQCEGLYVLPYVEKIREYHKNLISYRAHNIESEIWQRTTELQTNPLKKTYLRNLTRRMVRFEQNLINKYNILIPITDRDKEILNKKFGNQKPAITIPTGVNINEYPTNEKPKKNTLFYIGALDWMPNQEGLRIFFDKIWKKILEKNPEVKLYIAGRNAPKSLENSIKQQKNVFFLGEVEDAKKFMLSYETMIVPLYSGSGMRIKIIEAMAMAKPIVTTPIGAEGIGAENTKNIFIAQNHQEFIEFTNNLISNKKISLSVGTNARLFVTEKFDNFAIAKRLFDFYNKHLTNKNL